MRRLTPTQALKMAMAEQPGAGPDKLLSMVQKASGVPMTLGRIRTLRRALEYKRLG